MFDAYLDDFDTIVVIIKDSVYKSENFLLYDQIKFHNIVLINSLRKDGKYILTFKSDFDITLGIKFYVYSDEGISSLLIARKVIDTKRFELENFYQGDLGNVYTQEYTEFKLWSPVAFTVLVLIYKLDGSKITKELKRCEKGLFSARVQGDYEGCKYYYLVENKYKFDKLTDPYANTCAINNKGTVIIDLNKLNEQVEFNNIDNIIDSVIYEVSMRDTTSLIASMFEQKGYFNQFIQSGLKLNEQEIGYDYIKNLGITHVQIMPVQYCGSTDELSFFRKYNWGYDVMQHNVIEGYYASNPKDPYNRINELRALVDKLHTDNIGVILDVVYNHIFDVGASSFHKAVRGYYFRYNNEGYLYNGSGCGNDIASEKKMVQKYIVDSVYRLAVMYNIDGFRFDLMGLMDITTMKMIINKLSSLNRTIYLYGEGWNLQTKLASSKLCITQNASKLKNISFFAEELRDKVKGSTFNYQEYGIANANKLYYKDIKNIISGSIYESDRSVFQTINYLSCHDNHTLYDRYKLSGIYDIKRVVKTSYVFLLLSQGVSFMHMGCEFLRSKNGVANSYVSDDMINGINWQLVYDNKDVVDHVKDLIKIKKMYGCFRYKSNQEIIDNVVVNVNDDVVEVTYINYAMKLYINLKDTNGYVNVYNCVGVYVNGVSDFNDGFEVGETVVINPGSFLLLKIK